MSFNDIVKAIDVVKKTAEEIENNKEFLISPLLSRMTKAAEVYPADVTVRQMAAFLNNKSAKSDLVISRKELKSVYNAFPYYK